jgi:ribokinase
VLVATARVLPVLAEAGVQLDALVRSARDPSERYERGDLDPPPLLAVATAGERGGAWESADGRTGTFDAAEPQGEPADSYGAGDSFAAGLTYALAARKGREEALAFAAEAAAEALTRPGAHGLV